MQAQFYRITLGNHSKVAPKDKAMDVAGEVVRANGGGVPEIKPCDEHGNLVTVDSEAPATVPETERDLSANLVPAVVQSAPVAKVEPVYSDWNNTKVDEVAKARIEAQHKAIHAAGGPKIDTTQQYFASGTRMMRAGYNTQEQRLAEFKNKPLLTEAIKQLKDAVQKEQRTERYARARTIAENIRVYNRSVYFGDYLLTEQAIRGIIQRIESPSISYVLGLRDRVATNNTSSNINGVIISQDTDADMMAEVIRYECLRNPEVELKLRCRRTPHDVYAVLSPTYSVADAPQLMDNLTKYLVGDFPSDARGSWEYDNESTNWNLKAEIWSPVPIDEQAVGEAFSAEAVISSNDSGNGSLNGGGGITLLRCLNASTYSAPGEKVRRVHRGNVLVDIHELIKKSLKCISVLCQAWGKARHEELEVPTGLTVSQALGGYFMDMLKSPELVGIVPGRKEHQVKELSRAYEEQRRYDDKLMKSDLAQGYTSWIQTQPMIIRQEAENGIGNWLVKNRPVRCELKD